MSEYSVAVSKARAAARKQARLMERIKGGNYDRKRAQSGGSPSRKKRKASVSAGGLGGGDIGANTGPATLPKNADNA